MIQRGGIAQGGSKRHEATTGDAPAQTRPKQLQPCSFYLTTRHPRSHTLTDGDRSLKPTLSTAEVTNQGGRATVR
jgi:hypothetical protein